MRKNYSEHRISRENAAAQYFDYETARKLMTTIIEAFERGDNMALVIGGVRYPAERIPAPDTLRVKYSAPYTLETTYGYYNDTRWGYAASYANEVDAKAGLAHWLSTGGEYRLVDSMGVEVHLGEGVEA